MSIEFDVLASGDDGYAGKYDDTPTYPPTLFTDTAVDGTEDNPTRSYFSGFTEYDLYVTLIRFDTSSLDNDAVISDAKLRLYITEIQNADNRNLVGEWYASANWPIEMGDYTDTPASTAFSIPLSSLSTGQYNDIMLTTPNNVSKTGYTGFRLHISGGQPTGDNHVQYYTYDNGSNAPKLQVTLAAESASMSPSASPSKSPSSSPSLSPSASVSPSQSPSASPSISPSVSPSASPSISSSLSPSESPSVSPSASPSVSPSGSISLSQSMSPSVSPSISPSMSPSGSPSASPSVSPSVSISMSPSASPSKSPSMSPSLSPSASLSPSISLSTSPSRSPSVSPSVSPSEEVTRYIFDSTLSGCLPQGFPIGDSYISSQELSGCKEQSFPELGLGLTPLGLSPLGGSDSSSNSNYAFSIL